jgi:hypothetical protein
MEEETCDGRPKTVCSTSTLKLNLSVMQRTPSPSPNKR